MAKSKNFEIKDNKIIVKMGKLTEADIKTIKNYQTLFGYQIEEYIEPKLSKEEKAEEKSNSKFSRENIEKFLAENGTEEQIKKFKDIQEEIAIDKKTNKPKVWEKDTDNHKAGEVKKKGYIAGLQYVKQQFENHEYFKKK